MKRILFGMIILVFGILFTGCGSNRISVTELQSVIQEAQNKRVQELTDCLEQYIGEWECDSLFFPLTIGQDSTREQLGIELSGAEFQIREDYSVELNDEEYEILSVDIRDYSWYIDAYCQGPSFAEGLIVEITYKERQEGRERFSICVAENGIYLCSYAYGYYNVQEKNSGSETEKIELNQEMEDRVNEAYERRYGEASEYLENICGEWQGGKYIVSEEGYGRIEGIHTMEIRVLDSSQIEFCFDGNIMENELVEVIATGYFTQEQYKQAWAISDPNKKEMDMGIYTEGFVIQLKEKDTPIIMVLTRIDYADVYGDCELKMKLYYNEDIYRLECIK